MVEKILNNTTPYGKIRDSHEGSLHSSTLRRKNVNRIDYVHCCVIGCHGNSLLHFGLNTKISCEGLSGAGDLNHFQTSISQ